MPTPTLPLTPELHPYPRRITRTGEDLTWPSASLPIHLDRRTAAPTPADEALYRALKQSGLDIRSTPSTPNAPPPPRRIDLRVAPEASSHRESFHLTVTPTGASVTGSDPAGLFYGTHALAAWIRFAAQHTPGRVPGVEIHDHPAFPVRGIMIDVSRDRIPTVPELFDLIDELARWRINQLQLYTEHTFAYARHERVWRGWDPLTPEEIRALDQACSERFIELVPNQQSFGHMHHWLVHEPYRALAEVPEGVEHPFSHEPEPFSLAPEDPESLRLIEELYDELLPNFTSGELNVGLDETMDLGQGRSRAACEARGTGRVYLEFLQAIAERVRARGRRMQFWADILVRHPELVPEVPQDAIACLWGYEKDHPFEHETALVAEAGLDFLVCPGTSSWQSLAGRHGNMVGNLESAVHWARERGARGILVTDWGDRGHLQPKPASYPGWIVAADLSWNPDAPATRRTPEGLAQLVARHALGDCNPATGRALVQLSRTGELTGAHIANASPLSILLTAVDGPFPPERLAGLSVEGLERARMHIRNTLEQLDEQRDASTERCQLVEAELRWIAAVLDLAARLGIARLRSDDARPDPCLASGLAAELDELARTHTELWLRRSRPGGLERSRDWLERVARWLRGEPLTRRP